MILQNKIVVTGGKGLLASEIKLLLPNANYPDKDEMDITSIESIQNYLDKYETQIIINTAALMPPIKSQENPSLAIDVNIIGIGNITKECMARNIKLIYISTDYVFSGHKGNYSEEDELLPVNEYSWSKLGGECCVRLYKNSLIIRTSFGPKLFPYPKAYDDQWTSKERVDVIARKIVGLVDKDITGVIHIGGSRRTVLEYAKSLENGNTVTAMKRSDLNTGYIVPIDTSLNTSKYDNLIN